MTQMTVNNEKLMDASDESIEEARHSQKCIGCNTGEIMDRRQGYGHRNKQTFYVKNIL